MLLKKSQITFKDWVEGRMDLLDESSVLATVILVMDSEAARSKLRKRWTDGQARRPFRYGRRSSDNDMV